MNIDWSIKQRLWSIRWAIERGDKEEVSHHVNELTAQLGGVQLSSETPPAVAAVYLMTLLLTQGE